MPHLEAGVEILAPFEAPWPLGRPESRWVRLWSGTTYEEVGTVIAEIIRCGRGPDSIDGKPSDDMLFELMAREIVVVGGGIAARDANASIAPSCCVGLEQWRE